VYYVPQGLRVNRSRISGYTDSGFPHIMIEDVLDLRKGDRFVLAQPVEGTFNNSVPAVLLNFSLGGAQLQHTLPIRIGTRAPLTFHRGGVGATVMVIVLWSHLGQTPEGLRYRTGVKLAEPDVPYATALNSFIRSGLATVDHDSLGRKRERMLERERRKSGPKMSVLPPST
jgi:hypothetical protein